jgi:hypothetical protein
MRYELQDKKGRLITTVIMLEISTFTMKMFIYCTTNIYIKVKVSRNRPGVAQRVPGVLGSQIFMKFGT